MSISKGKALQADKSNDATSVASAHTSGVIPIPQARDSAEETTGLRPVLRHRVADALVDLLAELGVEVAFGLMGGAVVHVYDSLARSSIQLVHCRHEAGACFAAIEAYFASGRPVAVFTTTGPGLTNALTGIAAARWEGAKLVLIAGATSNALRGRWAMQETSSQTIGGLVSNGSLFDYAVTVSGEDELDGLASRLRAGFARPQGFVASISIPVGVQGQMMARRPSATLAETAPAGCDRTTLQRCADLLRAEPFAIWVGFGARGATAEVRELAARTRAPVFCTPRAKGIFPEDDPRFIGVSGVGGHGHVGSWLAEHGIQRTLVLGSKLGETSSGWDPALVPPKGFIHVDVDPSVAGAAFPTAPTLAVQAEISSFLRGLLFEIGDAPSSADAALADRPTVTPVTPVVQRDAGPVRPMALMDAVQRLVVDRSDALVMADPGNALLWATHHLRFNAPGRYRVAPGFGSMGHGVCGVLGAAIGRRGKAVGLVGDGAMLMVNELGTAVALGAPAVWVVLNDERYGMTHQGMQSLGFEPASLDMPRTDFVLLARALGADGVRVEHETELDAAIERALQARGPFVVDVGVDRGERSPMGSRIKQLLKGGGGAS